LTVEKAQAFNGAYPDPVVSISRNTPYIIALDLLYLTGHKVKSV